MSSLLEGVDPTEFSAALFRWLREDVAKVGGLSTEMFSVAGKILSVSLAIPANAKDKGDTPHHNRATPLLDIFRGPLSVIGEHWSQVWPDLNAVAAFLQSRVLYVVALLPTVQQCICGDDSEHEPSSESTIPEAFRSELLEAIAFVTKYHTDLLPFDAENHANDDANVFWEKVLGPVLKSVRAGFAVAERSEAEQRVVDYELAKPFKTRKAAELRSAVHTLNESDEPSDQMSRQVVDGMV